MKTSSFDAVVDLSVPEKSKIHDASLVFEKETVSASFSFYEEEPSSHQRVFVYVAASKPVSVRWGDVFRVQGPGSKVEWGKGRVLNPNARKSPGKGAKNKVAFLRQLLGDEKDLISVLAQKKGVKGLKEKEALNFAPLSKETLLALSLKLESEDQIRILSFSPLFLISQASFEFLCRKILSFLSRYHKTHPDELGVSLKEVEKKFDLPPRILSLALKQLLKEGRIKEVEKRLALIGFELSLTPEEEELLDRMEKMYLEGKLHSVSLEELRSRFRLSSRRLENLLSLLTERRKIVQGKDGFILHSKWLDELVAQIRNSGQKELSVADFKKMTGLSRKYAIPLLELLDQMGVTRRKGPTREIL
ncbi:MAG: SelB C-terminal domain-containing protein [Candidatus Aminicenantes bacterium]|jgi:selenocysteine-specific elongation factor